ncbi:DNA polymerase III subunit beta family protein [Escherichia coli]
MLFETEGEEARTVATDGHRVAVCSMPLVNLCQPFGDRTRVKGVIELMRMFDGGDNPLRVQIGSDDIRAHVGDFIFTSKLVDGRFRIIAAFCRKNRTNIWKLRWCLLSICSRRFFKEKFRGVRLYVSENRLQNHRQQPEQEEAEDILDVTYSGARWELASTSATCWMF